MFKPCNQNRSGIGGGFVYDSGRGWASSTESAGYYIFNVPEGVRFALLSIKPVGGSGAGLSADLKIDGIETNSLSRNQSEWPSWAEQGESGPMIEVKDKIEVSWGGTESEIVVNGYFFEV